MKYTLGEAYANMPALKNLLRTAMQQAQLQFPTMSGTGFSTMYLQLTDSELAKFNAEISEDGKFITFDDDYIMAFQLTWSDR